MTSILKVSTIQNTAGTAPTAADLGLNVAGSVLQVLQFVYPTYEQVTSSSYVATGITKAITPASSSSKILVNMTVTAGNSGSNTAENAFALYRSIGGGTASSIETFERAIFAHDTGGSGVHVDASIALSFLDSPSTTSAITYTLYARTNTGTLRINDHQVGGNGQSTITLMEIAG